MHVVYCNYAEHVNEDGVHFNGQSVVASPQGEHLLLLKPKDKGLFFSKPLEGLDKGGGAAEEGHEDDYLRDRRPELYRTRLVRAPKVLDAPLLSFVTVTAMVTERCSVM